MSNQFFNCKFWNIKNKPFVYVNKCKLDIYKTNKFENKQGEKQ